MNTNIVRSLERETKELLRRLDASPSARRLFNGSISLVEYVAFLEQTYHYVCWTQPLLALAGARLAALGGCPALAELLLRKAKEETGHEAWLLSDLAALGRDPASVKRSAPCAAVEAYVAWNRFTAESPYPTAFLGTAYVLESLSVHRGAVAVRSLCARSAIPRVREAVRFLRGHVEADDGHLAGLAAILAAVSDPQEAEMLLLSARTTRALYAGLFSSVGGAGAALPHLARHVEERHAA